jgi:NTP pyrophosphatase (non-canonical NTP hydrolase)
MENNFELIRQWADNKGIFLNSTSEKQFLKLSEEVGELANGLLKNNEAEIIDAIGDCVVVLTNIAALKGLKIEDCIQSAYDVISKRKGAMVNGAFVKEG